MGKEAAYTSIKQIPAGFKAFEFGSINLDWGGGKYDLATKYLKEHNTTNIIIDKFNQNADDFEYSWNLANNVITDTVSVFNVLNVIQGKKERAALLRDINKFCNDHKKHFYSYPVVIFQIYEGNRSGVPGTKTVQNNMKTADYLPEIQKAFPKWEPRRQGNFIIV